MVEDAKRQDMIKQLERSMEERKEQYLRFKETLQGLRLTNLSSTNKDIFAVVEVWLKILRMMKIAQTFSRNL